jgi:hypothetical protein
MTNPDNGASLALVSISHVAEHKYAQSGEATLDKRGNWG